MDKIVFATRNQGKIREIREIFRGIPVMTMDEAGVHIEIEETGTTFEENALLKARDVFRALSSSAENALVMSDDSGIEIDFLGGEPGVYSARFAGEHGDDAANNALLLAKLKGVPDAKRTARFVSCVVLHMQNGEELVALAASEGRILHQAVGEGGFGYDPLFWDERYQKSYAQLTAEQKNAISHRGKALALLQKKLEDRV